MQLNQQSKRLSLILDYMDDSLGGLSCVRNGHLLSCGRLRLYNGGSSWDGLLAGVFDCKEQVRKRESAAPEDPSTCSRLQGTPRPLRLVTSVDAKDVFCFLF